MKHSLSENEWKDLLDKASTDYVTTHHDSEVRRMFGHHYRSFNDGAIWERERNANLTKGITTPARDEYLLTLIELTAQFHEAKTNKQEEELLVKIASISYDAVVEKDKRIEELEEALKEILRFDSAIQYVNNALANPDNFIKSIDKAKELLNKK